MKKLINTSFIYFWISMVVGVFYREFTKFFDFTGKTTLSFLHSHLLVLGTFLFLILALFSINTNLLEQPKFNNFFKYYNIVLPFMVLMMGIKGVMQVLGKNSKIVTNVIAGFAGISHILILLCFVMLFSILKNLKINSQN